MDFLPVFMQLNGRDCLVVGGGEVASRKAALLIDAGATVHVRAPELSDSLQNSLAEGRIQHRAGEFEAADVNGMTLVIAATDDAAVNAAVHAAATAQQTPVNVVDDPDLCTFIMPSIVDRSPVIAAVSTGGSSPVLARMIRSRLETMIPSAYGRLAKMTADFRDQVKARFDKPADRRIFWEHILQGSVAEMVFAGRDEEAVKVIQQTLDSPDAVQGDVGEVYLVGGGPGDPDLLT
ncbi:MAG: siroheme synthase, partial [Gammaproteobacteria bacterium]|nr:siroheme synthase [Gammaproteobacteria bacterium]